jgi:hypothetical protein
MFTASHGVENLRTTWLLQPGFMDEINNNNNNFATTWHKNTFRLLKMTKGITGTTKQSLEPVELRYQLKKDWDCFMVIQPTVQWYLT